MSADILTNKLSAIIQTIMIGTVSRAFLILPNAVTNHQKISNSKFRVKSFISAELARHTRLSMVSGARDMTLLPFCFEALRKELSHISQLIGCGESTTYA